MQNFLSDCGIKIYNDVLIEEERLELLEQSKQYIQKLEGIPALQSSPDLHTRVNPQTIKTLTDTMGVETVWKCWAVYLDYDLRQTSWHRHPSKMSSVYYLDNPECRGTQFRTSDKLFQIDLPTNTLITFPGGLSHSPPENITQSRYTLAIDSDK